MEHWVIRYSVKNTIFQVKVNFRNGSINTRNMEKKALKQKKRNKKYTLNFKLDVLRFKQDTGASYKDTANAFGIGEPSIVANWKRQYVQEGAQGLISRKGDHQRCLNQIKTKKSQIESIKTVINLNRRMSY